MEGSEEEEEKVKLNIFVPLTFFQLRGVKNKTKTRWGKMENYELFRFFFFFKQTKHCIY